MKGKNKPKMITDVLMTMVLLHLMSYSLIGEMWHEILGIIMLLLFLLHQILNGRWYASIVNGRYNKLRIFMTGIDFVLLLLMILQMVSGILLSKHLFSFYGLKINITKIRLIHLAVPYWMFLVASLHLGFHWKRILMYLKKMAALENICWGLRLIVYTVSGYGIYVLWKRQFFQYMFLQIQYVFLDYNEPIQFFIMDYLAIMVLFTIMGKGLGDVLSLIHSINMNEPAYCH